MEPAKDEVHELLSAIIAALSNTLYDLSTDAEREGSKVTAKRLEFSRQKIMTAWETYNSKRANK
ncbi:hypothetical protein SRRS_49850 [Sporomusa rhizae]|uniref:hypothetical protein n=1 Tax=Sporomusa rhizae TaxID=357999 RepID=UPI00352B9FD1